MSSIGTPYSTLKELNSLFINWVEETYHQREHGTLGMKPIDRFGLDLGQLRYLNPSPYNKELFFVEECRGVRSDNTFNLKGVRYEAPRDLRNTKIEVRFDRNDPGIMPVVYSRGERMGEAWPVNFTGNDRAPKA